MNKRLPLLALFLLAPLCFILLPGHPAVEGYSGDCISTTIPDTPTLPEIPTTESTTTDGSTTIPCLPTSTTEAQWTTTSHQATTTVVSGTTAPQPTTTVAPGVVLPGGAHTGSGNSSNLGFTGPSLPATGESDAVSACEASVRSVKVVYQPRRAMEVGKQEVVEVVVTLPGAESPVSLPGNGQIVIANAELGCIVRARLIGGTGFEVDPKEAATKSFVNSDSIEFSWVVTPVKAGESTLNLQIESVIREGGYEYASNPRSFSAEISVKAKAKSVGGRVTDASQAFIDFPLVKGAKVIAGFAAVVAGLWGWLRRRSKTQGVKNTEEEGA